MDNDTCEACGERIVVGVQFCTSCGAYLGWREPGGTSGGAQAAPTTAAPRPPPPVTPGPHPITHPITQPTPVPPVAAVAGFVPTEAVTTTVDPVRTGPRCPQCATANETSRRFCRKCGLFIGQPTATASRAQPAPRQPWWRRWLPKRSATDRSARATYRKSLPLWIRLRRWIVAAVVIALVWVFLHFVGRDPLSWARQRIYALRGTVVAATNITAASNPSTADPKGTNAAHAIDGDPNTAWPTTFTGGTTAAGTPCARTADQTALELTSRTEITVRAINIRAGLALALNRGLFRSPTVFDLEFSDGSCRSVTVRDDPNWQLVRFAAVRTTSVRITVAAATNAGGGSSSKVAAISDVQLMVRPH
jgi:hypothetical protein